MVQASSLASAHVEGRRLLRQSALKPLITPARDPKQADFVFILGRGSGPRGLEMAAACRGVDSQVLASILDPFRSIFVDWTSYVGHWTSYVGHWTSYVGHWTSNVGHWTSPRQKLTKTIEFFVCLSSRPPIPLQSGEGQCHQVLIFTTTSCTQAPRPDPRTPP